MARKKSNAFVPPGYDLDLAPFSIEWLTELIPTVKLTATISEPELLEDLAHRMNAAAIMRHYWRDADKAPSALSLRKDMLRIKKLASELVELMPIVWDESTSSEGRSNPHVIGGIANPLIEAMEGAGQSGTAPGEDADPDAFWVDADPIFNTPRDKLYAMVETLTAVRDASAKVVERLGKPARAPAGTADRDFAIKLASFYEELFGRTLGFSRDSTTGDPGGPFLQFARTCFTAIGAPRPDETILSWIRDWRASQEKQATRT